MFKYKNRKLILYVVILTLGTATLFATVLELINNNAGTDMIKPFLGGAILLFIGTYGSNFYWKNRNAELTLDENGIKQQISTVTTSIRWEEITKVDILWLFDEYDSYFWGLFCCFGKSSFLIKITSNTNESIKIGSDIADINKIIIFLKSKLGDKFNTREIPVKYKLLKEK